MNITRRIAVAGVGLLGALGAGAGIALAQPAPTPTLPPPSATSTPSQAQATAPDKAPEAPEATGRAERPGAEESGDTGLPGGGHADTAGQNADHQFEGVE
jgi:hypothetical protein